MPRPRSAPFPRAATLPASMPPRAMLPGVRLPGVLLRGALVLGALFLGALVLGACAQRVPQQPPSVSRQVADECRAAADRVIERRDRGDLLREDERSARLGAGGGQPAPSNSEELRRSWDRDRLAAECQRGELNPPPAAAGAPAGAPAAEPARGR